MSRWHKHSCAHLDISVKETIPYCSNCDSSPDLNEIISSQPGENSGLNIPFNEAPGEMNLWWPPSVPYTKESGIEVKSRLAGERHDSSVGDHENVSNVTGFENEATELDMRHLIYDKRLRSDQIRVICFSATSDNDAPVHLSLEVYDSDHWPDYETVSYTWGGEDNDNTFRKPVYIDPFWDILLQTKNCHSMLQFMRPARGIRLVWVDAVCINQADLTERAEQVANMGRIYRECERVIVYLGPDMVVNTSNPRRQTLDQLGMDTKSQGPDISRITLNKLLRRRYFGRLWIIQTLLLAPRIVFRVGETNYWYDGGMQIFNNQGTDESQSKNNDNEPQSLTSLSEGSPSSSSSLSYDWNIEQAPWVEFLSKGKIPGHVCEVAATVSSSSAGDPRDRFFGILGMVEASDDDHMLLPNYDLSVSHIFIGFLVIGS